MTFSCEFSAELWEYQGEAPWVFVTLPTDLSDEIADLTPTRPGFGSVRVIARLGETEWRTSVFPDAKTGAYVLPIKRQVRVAEGLDICETATIRLVLAQAEAGGDA